MKLPNKPSLLLSLALKDLEKAERSPKYTIDMGVWHKPSPGRRGHCQVCLGGAVLAFSLKFDPYVDVTSTSYLSVHCLGQKLSAIDNFRKGCVRSALGDLGIRQESGIQVVDRRVENYHHDAKAFKRDMKTLIKDLKQMNL
jgi:hypothetical protein